MGSFRRDWAPCNVFCPPSTGTPPCATPCSNAGREWEGISCPAKHATRAQFDTKRRVSVGVGGVHQNQTIWNLLNATKFTISCLDHLRLASHHRIAQRKVSTCSVKFACDPFTKRRLGMTAMTTGERLGQRSSKGPSLSQFKSQDDICGRIESNFDASASNRWLRLDVLCVLSLSASLSGFLISMKETTVHSEVLTCRNKNGRVWKKECKGRMQK